MMLVPKMPISNIKNAMQTKKTNIRELSAISV